MKYVFNTLIRDKNNYIFTFLIIIMLLIILTLLLIKSYYIYSINFIYGKYEENRGYILEVDNIEDIEKNFVLEKSAKEFNEFTEDAYYVVIKDYQDVNNFTKYLDNKKIVYYLKDTTKSLYIDIINNNLKIYNVIINICTIIFIGIVFLIIYNLNNHENKNNSLLKVIGYNNHNIFKYTIIKHLLIFLFIIIFTITLILLFKYSYVFISNVDFKNYCQYINLFILSKYYCLLMITILINEILLYFKLRNNSELKILGEVDNEDR